MASNTSITSSAMAYRGFSRRPDEFWFCCFAASLSRLALILSMAKRASSCRLRLSTLIVSRLDSTPCWSRQVKTGMAARSVIACSNSSPNSSLSLFSKVETFCHCCQLYTKSRPGPLMFCSPKISVLMPAGTELAIVLFN